MGRLEELRQRFKSEPLGIHFGATLGHFEAGHAVVSVNVKDEFLIVDGIVQGGITTAIADFAGVYAAMSKLETGHTPAMNINIYFLSPIKTGETITAVADVINESRRTILTRVDVFNQDRENKAYATILFAKPKA